VAKRRFSFRRRKDADSADAGQESQDSEATSEELPDAPETIAQPVVKEEGEATQPAEEKADPVEPGTDLFDHAVDTNDFSPPVAPSTPATPAPETSAEDFTPAGVEPPAEEAPAAAESDSPPG
jgi:hypothetical protein